MKVIKEYLLNKDEISKQTLYLPKKAEIVGVQNFNDSLRLIVLGSPGEFTTLRTFKVCSSEETIYNDTVKYIGSYLGDYGLRHIVEIF